MNKTAKGAIAATAAAAVLMGGAGSLAYWTDAQTAGGTTVKSGQLALTTDDTNTGCGSWTLNGSAYTAGTSLLVPGDVLTENCAFTLTATGDNLSGTVSATTPTLTGTLASALQTSVSDITVGGAAATSFTSADNNKAVGLTVTVTFPGSSDDTTQNLTAALSDVTITVAQDA